MRIGYIGVMEEPKCVEISPNANGSYLSALQSLVHGLIEPFGVLFGESPMLYVNEEGMLQGMGPNRAVYATKSMEKNGYLSQLDFSTSVKEGDCYAVLYGPILAVSHDENGNFRDISDDEWDQVRAEFSGPESMQSGLAAFRAIVQGQTPPPRAKAEDAPSLADEAQDMAAASNELKGGRGSHTVQKEER